MHSTISTRVILMCTAHRLDQVTPTGSIGRAAPSQLESPDLSRLVQQLLHEVFKGITGRLSFQQAQRTGSPGGSECKQVFKILSG